MLTGTGQGFTVQLSYTPSSAVGDSFAYSGGGSGVTMSGSGTYTIAEGESATLTLRQEASGCVVGGGCSSTSEIVTLTPIP